jgi:DNA-binding XRE family transcriptional regulator
VNKKSQCAALIRTHCDRVGVPLASLAREVGLSLDALRKIDSGRRDPLLTTALRIADALGVEVEDIFGRR